ncbi:other/FunK1 protein kinase [Coprinopsis cinerea AmutBmut pab1-1]|nr:other/FunK1 protein kinase [Coprinopsis cinerea AmutBmut pab1-1]
MKTEDSVNTLLKIVGNGAFKMTAGVEGASNSLWHVVDESGRDLVVKDGWKYTGNRPDPRHLV